jgi:hypothetical protein
MIRAFLRMFSSQRWAVNNWQMTEGKKIRSAAGNTSHETVDY